MNRFCLHAIWLAVSAFMFCLSVVHHWTLASVTWGICSFLNAALLLLMETDGA